MLAALRYRRAQTVVVVVLSALVTTCLVLAPLYTRALEQAMVRTMLSDAPVEQTGLRLSSTSQTEPAVALTPDALEQLPPETIRGYFGPPIASTAIDVRRMPAAGQPGNSALRAVPEVSVSCIIEFIIATMPGSTIRPSRSGFRS